MVVIEDIVKRAEAARNLRLETMEEARKVVDEVEALIPPEHWTLATYKELLFLDFQYGSRLGMPPM